MKEMLLSLFYPPRCMCCGKLLKYHIQSVCPECASALPWWDGAGRTLQYFVKTAVVFTYERGIRDALLWYKFGGCTAYAGALAQFLRLAVERELTGKFDVISWVPCSKLRRWVRGFDQAKLLAEALAKELDMPCVKTLRKIRHNRKQSSIPDASRRRANVLGAYQAVSPEKLSGVRILLVDDILTTGATLTECGKTLRLAGSGDLVCAVVAAGRK